MPIISTLRQTLRRLREKDHEFKTSLSYLATSCLTTPPLLPSNTVKELLEQIQVSNLIPSHITEKIISLSWHTFVCPHTDFSACAHVLQVTTRVSPFPPPCVTPEWKSGPLRSAPPSSEPYFFNPGESTAPIRDKARHSSSASNTGYLYKMK